MLADSRQPYTDLLNLCMTSRKLNPLALRALYHTVQIYQFNQAINILVQVLRHPERRVWIRVLHLGCHCPMVYFHPCYSALSTRVQSLLPIPTDAIEALRAIRNESTGILATIIEGWTPTGEDDFRTDIWEFTQRVLYALLCLMPRLKCWTMNTVHTNRHEVIAEAFDMDFSEHRDRFLKPTLLAQLIYRDLQRVEEGHCDTTEPVACPNLRTVGLCSNGMFPWSRLQAMPLLLFPRLERVDLLRIDGFWTPNMYSRFPSASITEEVQEPLDYSRVFKRILHLRVFADFVHISAFKFFAERASNLESLEIGSHFVYNGVFRTEAYNFNTEILPLVGNTLTRLTIHDFFTDVHTSMRLFGPDETVDLRVLPRLEQLAAPAYAIFAVPGTAHADAPSPKLKVLKIMEDRWSYDRREKYALFLDPLVGWKPPRFSGKLFDFIMKFASTFRTRFPNLEQVVFQYYHWNDPALDWSRDEVEQVRAAFRKQGVSFAYEEYRVETDDLDPSIGYFSQSAVVSDHDYLDTPQGPS
jgi:hypothetical protein